MRTRIQATSAALWLAGLTVGVAAHAATRTVIGPRQPDTAQAAVIQRAFGARYDSLLPYNFGRVDLNGDGRPDLIVWPQNNRYCGIPGCMMFVVPTTAQGYGAAHEMTVSQDATLTVLDSTHRGMHDISFSGRLAGSHVAYRWNGSHYIQTGPIDDGSLQFHCSGPVARRGRKAVADDRLPVGSRPGACFAIAAVYDFSSGEIIATEPSPRCPGARAIDIYTLAFSGGYYAVFQQPVCGASIRLGPPQDMRRIATVLIDGRRYGDIAGIFNPLP